MAMNNFSSDDAPRTPATNKKPYEKPTFRYEQVFVTSALSCGKVNPISQGCAGAQKAS
jgi:hypothetical protein